MSDPEIEEAYARGAKIAIEASRQAIEKSRRHLETILVEAEMRVDQANAKAIIREILQREKASWI